MTTSIQKPQPVARIARPHIPDTEKNILLPLEIRLMAFARYLTPALEAQLREEFAEYLQQEQFPVLVGNRLIDRICATTLQDHPTEKARELLGYAYLKQYQDSLVGVLLAPVDVTDDFDWVMQGLPRNWGDYIFSGEIPVKDHAALQDQRCCNLCRMAALQRGGMLRL